MANVFEPEPLPEDSQFGIVVSRYNEQITRKLLDGAVATLREHGVSDDRIEIAWVPGAWELPMMAALLLGSDNYNAILCLGAVIRGETTHDQHINRSVGIALQQLAVDTLVPIQFGLLTCETLEQAIQRAGGNVGNKGVECAEAAIAMVRLAKSVERSELA